MKSATQIKQTAELVKAIGEAIKEAGAIPSGHLYSILMGFGCTLEQYEALIDAFKATGKIREVNNLLYWIG